MLSGSLDDEAGPLAELIGNGKTAYELQVLLSGVLPRVVLRCNTNDEAQNVLEGIRKRGHGALAVAMEDLLSVATTDMHRVALREGELCDEDRLHRKGERLRLADVHSVVVVSVRGEVERTTKEIVAHSTLRRQPDKVVEHTGHEHVLSRYAYLWSFPENAPPRVWVVSENDSGFLGLLPALHKTRHENFAAFLVLLKERSSLAAFDDRFAVTPLVRATVAMVRGTEAVGAAQADVGVQMVVYLLARWLRQLPVD